MTKSKMKKMETGVELQRVGAYVRVSTDAQAEEGYSIEIQRERLTAYAKGVMGAKEFTLYVDDGYSGASLDRPRMTDLIADVKGGNLDCVVVYKLDRLSRSQKDTLYLIEDIFLAHNTAFISVSESFDTSTAFGRAVVGILSVFAQLERENIYDRTRSGMLKRVQAGYWPGGGRVPFGYDYDSGQGILVPNADAEKVRRLYDLYLEGYALQYIADKLGLKYEKLAQQILTRKSNTGMITYNGAEYPGRHEAIVPPEIYDRAMFLMARRGERRLVSRTEHLLTGLVFCGRCGARMRYIRWGKGGYKLMCYSQQTSKKYLIKDPDCDNGRPWAEEIESIVVQDLFALSKGDLGRDGKLAAPKSALELLQERRAGVEARLKKLYHLYAAGTDEALLKAVEETREELRKVTAELSAEEEKQLATKERDRTLEHLGNLAQAWAYMVDDERRNALRAILSRVVIDGEQVTLDYRF